MRMSPSGRTSANGARATGDERMSGTTYTTRSSLEVGFGRGRAQRPAMVALRSSLEQRARARVARSAS